MLVKNKVVVITGAARGIGEALARRFHKEGARTVAVADLDEAAAQRVANDIGGFAMRVDVSREADIQALVDAVTKKFGPIDLFCSHAGIFIPGDIFAPDTDWAKMRDIHVMAHVY